MHVDLVVDIVNIDEHLGRLADAGDGFEGVVFPEQSEIGYRVELIQIGAGNGEEVADHEVRGPRGEQVREGIKDVVDVAPLRRDDVVDLGGEGFKAASRIQVVHPHVPVRLYDGSVAGEPHVDHLLPVRDRPLREGPREGQVIVDGVNLPYDVVARSQPVDDLVDARDARAFPCKYSGHARTPALRPPPRSPYFPLFVKASHSPRPFRTSLKTSSALLTSGIPP